MHPSQAPASNDSRANGASQHRGATPFPPTQKPPTGTKPVTANKPVLSAKPAIGTAAAAASSTCASQASHVAREQTDGQAVKTPPRNKVPPRPYFFPDDCKLEQLPQGTQLAIAEFVTPCSQQAIGEDDPLKKSATATMTFELALEILSQNSLMSAVLDPDTDQAKLERRQGLHDRIVKRKLMAENLLLRLRAQESREHRQGLLRRPR